MRIFIAILVTLTLTILGLRSIIQEDTSDLQRFAQGYESYENGTLIELGSAFFFNLLSLNTTNSITTTFKLILLELFAIYLITRRKERNLRADLIIMTVLFPYIFCINLKYIGVLFVMLLFSNFRGIQYLSFLSVFFHASMALPISLYFLKKLRRLFRIFFFVGLLVIFSFLAFYFERYLDYFVVDQKFPFGLLVWSYTIFHFFHILSSGYTTSKILIVISIILLPFFITLAGRILLLSLLFSLFENNYNNRIRYSYINSIHLLYFFSYGIYQFVFMTGIF